MTRRRFHASTVSLGIAALAVLVVPRMAPGTVAEQRARLPPPAICEDDVEGYWKSHQFSPRYQDWTEFSLEIHRVEDSETELTGRITNHTWEGGVGRVEPGQCDGAFRYLVSMEARGTIVDDFILFGGTNWHLDEVICGFSPGFWYNLDNFTGDIDYDIQEFQSVNNDGGRSVNEPTVFRRVRCLEDEEEIAMEVDPPAFYLEDPESGGGGCNAY